MPRKNLYNVGALLAGLGVTFKFMFAKKPTIQYPSQKKKHAPRFHGLHELRRYGDGKERCIGCELCSSVCPANAITVIGAENTPEDRRSPGERYAQRYEIDELRCIFCGMCEEACPTDAIVLTPRFEMSEYRRGALIYGKDRLLVPEHAGTGVCARRPSQRHSGGFGARCGHQIDRGMERRLRCHLARDRFENARKRLGRRMIEFYILAAVLIASAVFVVTARKAVYSVVGLLVHFAALAIMYFSLAAEFLAVIQIIVYSGAILMLFLFVIALLSSGVAPFSLGPNRLPRIAAPAVFGVVVILGFLIYAVARIPGVTIRTGAAGAPPIAGPVGTANVFGSVSNFGRALFTTNLLPFEITAFILMVAVIGVILLAGDSAPYVPTRKRARLVEREMREAILRAGEE